jgi:hypothetical protein
MRQKGIGNMILMKRSILELENKKVTTSPQTKTSQQGIL